MNLGTISSSLPSPFRSGSLGLSKAELDARCQPSGLYPKCEWEPKQIRRLIGDGKLAARLKGGDSCLSAAERECPICFMFYSETNVTRCCSATVCTECYLQLFKSSKEKFAVCPFCNNPKCSVQVQSGMDDQAIAEREKEEQRVIEATIRSRSGHTAEGSGSISGSSGSSSFGSELENYNRSRARTFSRESAVSESSGYSGLCDSESALIMSVAMSPDERRSIEQEMRSQLSHETHVRMENEAEEARVRHAQEWFGSGAGARSRVRETRLAELTGLLERMSAREEAALAPAVESGGNVGLSGLLREDLARLEQHMLGLHSRRNELQGSSSGGSRRSSRNTGYVGSGAGGVDDPRLGPLGARISRRFVQREVSATHLDTAELLMRGVSEEEQLALAIAMSMQDHQENQNREDSNDEDEQVPENGESTAASNENSSTDED